MSVFVLTGISEVPDDYGRAVSSTGQFQRIGVTDSDGHPGAVQGELGGTS